MVSESQTTKPRYNSFLLRGNNPVGPKLGSELPPPPYMQQKRKPSRKEEEENNLVSAGEKPDGREGESLHMLAVSHRLVDGLGRDRIAVSPTIHALRAKNNRSASSAKAPEAHTHLFQWVRK